MDQKDEKLITLAEAEKFAPYDQGYLSLRARSGKLKAQKVGRNWFTTREWLDEYIRENKPEFFERKVQNKKKIKAENHKFTTKQFRLIFVGALALVILTVLVTSLLIDKGKNEKEQQGRVFEPEEVIAVPDDNGQMQYYGWGKMKLDQVE